MKQRVDVTRLCAEAVLKIPHDQSCNVQFGLACTCEKRTERVIQGLAGVLRSVARRRQALRDDHTDAIYDSLVKVFRKHAGGTVYLTIRVK